MVKIILLGYMGSGKSTIAKLAAKKMGLPFIDLDAKIEERENASVENIFERNGEIYFRKIEHEVFKELMASNENFLLSLGGGTPCYAGNHEFLNGFNITSIYLKASIKELCERLIKSKIKRPLIANMNNEELSEFIARHLFERSFFYTKATHTIVVDGKSPSLIVSQIELLVK